MNKSEVKRSFITKITKDFSDSSWKDIYVAGSYGDNVTYPAIIVSIDSPYREIIGENGGLISYDMIEDKKTVMFLYQVFVGISVYSHILEESEDIADKVIEYFIEGDNPTSNTISYEHLNRNIIPGPTKLVEGQKGKEKLWLTPITITITVKEIKIF